MSKGFLECHRSHNKPREKVKRAPLLQRMSWYLSWISICTSLLQPEGIFIGLLQEVKDSLLVHKQQSARFSDKARLDGNDR